jgi:hypothetical protein
MTQKELKNLTDTELKESLAHQRIVSLVTGGLPGREPIDDSGMTEDQFHENTLRKVMNSYKLTAEDVEKIILEISDTAEGVHPSVNVYKNKRTYLAAIRRILKR